MKKIKIIMKKNNKKMIGFQAIIFFVKYNLLAYYIDMTTKIHVLLIEADNQNSLGGSCMRDLWNMDRCISEYCRSSFGQRIVLTEDSRENEVKAKARFPQYERYTLNQYRSIFPRFVQGVKEEDYVIIMISGHGYQKVCTTGEEEDGMDEYISFNTGILVDNDLYTYLVSKLVAKRTICLADTCHSGTMFDNTEKTKNVVSIGGCQDNELDSCDIGDTTGFGGALTVHLLDQPNIIQTLLHGSCQDYKNLVSRLTEIMKPLRQKPRLICGFP